MIIPLVFFFFFFSSRRRHTRYWRDWSSDVCSSDLQFYVADGRLSCQLYQRSADLFLGVPFNIASYALLTQMVAQQVDLAPGDLIWVGGDCHVYTNHVQQVREQLAREVLPFPQLALDRAPSLFEYAYEDLHLVDYRHHPAIR